MKTIILSVFLFIISISMNAQSGWQTLNSGYTSSINDLMIIDDTIIHCVGGSATAGEILKSTDGGLIWSSQSMGTSTLNAIAGTSAARWAVGNGGTIYYSSNGTTWTTQSSGTTTNLNDVQFPTATTGYAVGGAGIIRKTINGTTWSDPIISGGTTFTLNAVHFTDVSNGVVGGDYNFIQGFINRTTSGASYFGLPSTTISKINDIYFVSATTGFAAAESGNIFKTTNSGMSWTPLSSGTTSHINAIHFSDTNNGYAVGDGGIILHTINGGTTWVTQNSPTIENLNSIYCYSNDTAYAVGDNGTIIKTESAGVYLELSMADDTTNCSQPATIIANPAYSGSGTLTYTWTTNGPTPASINGNTLVTGNLTQSYDYYCTVTDGTLSSTDTMTVYVGALDADSICLVTVDDVLGHNVVVFEKHIQGAIDYYKIYAESSVVNVYDSIGFIPADSAGVFEDINSNPAVKAYSYKISNVDSCGNESALSGKHKTMHLSINQGAGSSWNLLWNYYEGIPVQTYRIWRTDPSMNWVKIDSVGGLNNSFTDLNPPAGALYYQVEIVSPYICQPYNYKANTNYNTSRSNTANNGIIPQSLSADFNADITSGVAPLTVNFQNTSLGSPENYIWYFGDGDTSSMENPLHTYQTEGLYSVKLVISTTTESDSITINDYIDVLVDGINLSKANNIKLFPNPLNKGDNLVIEHKGVQIKEIELMNILGKKIAFNSNSENGSTIISFYDIAKGIYFVSIIDSYGNKVQKKFIIK
ncbi:MAG: hypothetical protein B6I18_00050 [Bacteroidetes bacterium 4572_112]|nr:MAG: hypothetical protein B6I18_00050 [Bacteroidetes bacterium 4572_112]